MKEGVQTLLAELGEGACLALCICELGKPGLTEGEALSLILEGIRRRHIRYDEEDRNNPDNCYVADRDALMNLVTGERGWRSSKESPDYRARPQEKIIEGWEWKEYAKNRIITHHHFRLPDWDPIKNSVTVKLGKIESLRVFRKTA